MFMKIAIDGPSGSGKSTIAKELAKALNINYLDTGAMYRALAYKLRDKDFVDEKDLVEILDKTDLRIKDNQIYLDGDNVGPYLRQEEIGKLASEISKYQVVRKYLVDMQQKISRSIPVVMDGRDIGTVVMPDADYKFFLTADLKTRSKRRRDQLKDQGIDISLDKVEKDLRQRDFEDMNRDHSPLKKASDAREIDNSNLTVEETLDLIINLIGGNNVL